MRYGAEKRSGGLALNQSAGGDAGEGMDQRPKGAEKSGPARPGGPSGRKAARPQKTAVHTTKSQKVREIGISREALVRRIMDVRRTGLVVLVARAVGGVLITLFMTSAAFWFLSIPFALFNSGWVITPLSILTAAALVVAAAFASVRSVPQAAVTLKFLREKAFWWVDPFRDERPQFLPMWLEAILWAPTQVLAGAIPFKTLRETGPADAEAAADLARRMAEEGELDLSIGMPAGSPDEKGLRFLLLLRLVRLVTEEGKLRARISGLGQAALFEGTVA